VPMYINYSYAYSNIFCKGSSGGIAGIGRYNPTIGSNPIINNSYSNLLIFLNPTYSGQMIGSIYGSLLPNIYNSYYVFPGISQIVGNIFIYPFNVLAILPPPQPSSQFSELCGGQTNCPFNANFQDRLSIEPASNLQCLANYQNYTTPPAICLQGGTSQITQQGPVFGLPFSSSSVNTSLTTAQVCEPGPELLDIVIIDYFNSAPYENVSTCQQINNAISQGMNANLTANTIACTITNENPDAPTIVATNGFQFTFTFDLPLTGPTNRNIPTKKKRKKRILGAIILGIIAIVGLAGSCILAQSSCKRYDMLNASNSPSPAKRDNTISTISTNSSALSYQVSISNQTVIFSIPNQKFQISLNCNATQCSYIGGTLTLPQAKTSNAASLPLMFSMLMAICLLFF